MKTKVAKDQTDFKKRFQAFTRITDHFPHPATIFAALTILTIIFSSVAASLNIEAVNPATKEIVRPIGLLNIEGLHRLLTSFVTNFTNFTPLGTVLVAMLGISVAEASGFTGALMKFIISSAPTKLIPIAVVFAGIISHTFGDVGFVVLIPLAPIVYMSVGKHPIAGLVAAYAAVSGGFCSNLTLGVVDPLLAGLTQQAAQIVVPDYKVNPAVNYYFMVVSGLLIIPTTTIINEKITKFQVKEYISNDDGEVDKTLSRDEKRGLVFSLITGAIFILFLLSGTLPQNGFLRDPNTGSILQSPFMSGIITLLFLGSVLIGLSFGLGAKTFRSDKDVINGMGKSLNDVGLYLIIVFFAAQYVTLFNLTNLGLIFSINSAETLKSFGMSGIPLIIAFIFLTIVIDLLISSAFAKWTIMAPIFVPMFMMLGYSPELVQMAYRIGDSLTNLVSPFLVFIPLFLVIAQRYDAKMGIGTFIKLMFPYFCGYLLVTVTLLIVWILLDLPLGPGGYVYSTIAH